MALWPYGPTAHFAMYLTKRDLGHEDGGMQEQMRCLESLADGQTHIRGVRIESHDAVRSTPRQLAKKSPSR